MRLLLLAVMLCMSLSIGNTSETVSYSPHTISDSAEMWWARVPADINGDGTLDVALQNNNARGGWLGWIEAVDGGASWKTHIITETAPNGEAFASGDLDAADMDGDGDVDILAFAQAGEWDESSADTTIYWYENPSWEAHKVGTAPDFVKDTNIADVTGDGKPDVIAITFETNTIVVYAQTNDGWDTLMDTQLKNLHEGMDVGDIDGDGDIDIVPNGYWLENPGSASGEWKTHVIDARWNNQDGDWSRNATKVACADLIGDGKAEVFISHSERKGYPVAMYTSADPTSGDWSMIELHEGITACHTLQVLDADNDGDLDVLAGSNKNRAIGLEEKTFPVMLFMNGGDAKTWSAIELSDEGIYNGQVGDVDGDGVTEIFRLQTHDGTVLELWKRN